MSHCTAPRFGYAVVPAELVRKALVLIGNSPGPHTKARRRKKARRSDTYDTTPVIFITPLLKCQRVSFANYIVNLCVSPKCVFGGSGSAQPKPFPTCGEVVSVKRSCRPDYPKRRCRANETNTGDQYEGHHKSGIQVPSPASMRHLLTLR